MRSKNLKIVIGVIIVLIFGFFSIGYKKSDYKYYNDFLTTHKLTNPKEVFSLVTKSYGMATDEIVLPNYSPRYLMVNHKVLWCDEGSMVIAMLNHYLGYKTRLIDLYGNDNISHHTVMQVLESGKWVTYDFSFHLYNKPFYECSKIYKYKVKYYKARTYPKFYNKVVNSNTFLKAGIFKIRRINEPI